MDELKFWQQKIVQAFHDPPGKVYFFYARTSGHHAVAQELFNKFVRPENSDRRFFYKRRPDRAAAGADRPVLTLPRGTRGKLGNLPYHKEGQNIVLHPLGDGCPLVLTGDAGAEAVEPDLDELELDAGDAQEAFDPKKAREQAASVLESLSKKDAESAKASWGSDEELKRDFRVLWRGWRDALAHYGIEEGERRRNLVWERMPADSRGPDHSIWEHLKITSALAFLDREVRQKVEEYKEPWLFSFSLYPVQEFIAQSRKSRDLWVSSFLLSELAWAAMLPIVERYGPDAIVYPELRGNPRVDNWLKCDAKDKKEGPLPKGAYPHTHAALIPNSFVAIVPRGSAGHLQALEGLAKQCAESMAKRWHELAKLVEQWLEEKTGNARGWKEIWARQHQVPPITSYWSAVHWQVPEPVENAEELKRLTQGGALPAQDREKLPPPSEQTLEAARARKQRLGTWVDPEVWAHYERARSVFGQVHLGFLQGERGFDYALTHHELRVRQQLRKQEARYELVLEKEEGEKCTQCRQREALYDKRGESELSIDALRQQVRAFWANPKLDDEQSGAERLCGICAFKRFLVEACGEGGINAVWGEPKVLKAQINDGGVRFPFPSTSAIAMQGFLEKLATSNHARVREAMARVEQAHSRTRLGRTLFPETLPRLEAARQRDPRVGSFLKIEPQESCLPDTLTAAIERERREGREREAERLKELQEAVRELRRAARAAGIEEPDTHFALIRIDGDRLGSLLVGDPAAVKTRWRDVLHPWVLERLEKEDSELAKRGWASLLDSPRLMGPSLHAFISRALADFSHRIVPWVVEQEYGGRLIYAGGDDVLAMAPARDALPMAARLQQLFRASWIVDTMPDIQAFGWRSGADAWRFDPKKARQRFVIPKRPSENGARVTLPLQTPGVELPVGLEEGELEQTEFDGQVLTGLGPHQSLSASIVYGHFKTQLSTMLRRGAWLLDHVAKGTAGRSAVALAHHSRGGLKTESALKWELEDASGKRVGAQALVDWVIGAFRSEALPQRLPYKLRAVSGLLLAVEEKGEGSKNPELRRLAEGLLRQALEASSGRDEGGVQAALTLWLAGYDHARIAAKAGAALEPERFVDGLLLCRYLAGHGEEEE
jgi:CRISPR-associated protein Cmr2